MAEFLDRTIAQSPTHAAWWRRRHDHRPGPASPQPPELSAPRRQHHAVPPAASCTAVRADPDAGAGDDVLESPSRDYSGRLKE
jgi:hypothetical protein